MPSAKELLEETKEPEVTGMNRVVDFIAQRLNPEWFATSGRTLLETAQGTKTPITEKNFKPEELDVIRQLVDVKGKDKGSISYADYIQLARKIAKEKGEPLPSSVTPSLFSMADPLGNIQTTLGRFTYQTDPKGKEQRPHTGGKTPGLKNLIICLRIGNHLGNFPNSSGGHWLAELDRLAC